MRTEKNNTVVSGINNFKVLNENVTINYSKSDILENDNYEVINDSIITNDYLEPTILETEMYEEIDN